MLQIGEVLDQARCAAIREALAPSSLWRDGADTAAGRAQAVKRNLQAAPESPEVAAVMEIIAEAVLRHPIIASAAIPERIVRILLSRTEPGGGYGDHVDAAYMDGQRTDLAFTLFLSELTDYGGGELVMDGIGATDSIKLPAGALVLYPSNLVHRVETVSSGVRLVAAGWIKSRIRSAEARAVIFELDQICRFLDGSDLPATALNRLQNVKNNLLRLHGA